MEPATKAPEPARDLADAKEDASLSATTLERSDAKAERSDAKASMLELFRSKSKTGFMSILKSAFAEGDPPADLLDEKGELKTANRVAAERRAA